MSSWWWRASILAGGSSKVYCCFVSSTVGKDTESRLLLCFFRVGKVVKCNLFFQLFFATFNLFCRTYHWYAVNSGIRLQKIAKRSFEVRQDSGFWYLLHIHSYWNHKSTHHFGAPFFPLKMVLFVSGNLSCTVFGKVGEFGISPFFWGKENEEKRGDLTWN